MRRRSYFIAGILALLILAVGGWMVYHKPSSRPSSTPAAAAAQVQVQTVNGETVLTVPVEMQRASGIDVTRLAAAAVQPEQTVFATVIDLQPLFDLGNRLAAAQADRNAAQAQAEASQAQAARSQALYRDDANVSQKAVQDANAVAQADQAKLRAAQASVTGLQAVIREQFGEAVANAAQAPTSGLWRKLASGGASIVRVTFSGAATQVPEVVTLDLPSGGRSVTHKLSAAVPVDPMVQGAAYFYLAAPALAPGMRTVGHAVHGDKSIPGVLVPDSAVVWYGNERWSYVKSADVRFTRRLIGSALPQADGVLATSGLRPGDEVVTRGAELLLSEEQRPRGIATQCKDPPECDD